MNYPKDWISLIIIAILSGAIAPGLIFAALDPTFGRLCSERVILREILVIEQWLKQRTWTT